MKLVERITNLVVDGIFGAKRSLTLWVLIVISLVFAVFLPRLHYNHDFERQFPINDPDTDFYLQFREQFGSDKNFVLIGVKTDKQLSESDFWRTVVAVDTALLNVPEVIRTVTATNFTLPVRNSFSGVFYEIPYIKKDSLGGYYLDRERAANAPLFQDLFLSKKKNETALLLFYNPDLSLLESKVMLGRLRSALQGIPTVKHYHFGGPAVSQNYFVSLTQQESRKFIGASVVLIVAFLWLAFRNWRGIILPLALVGLSLLWLMGGIGASGIPLDIVLKILPTIIMIIGLSDVVHLFTKISEELQKGHEAKLALRNAIREVGMATFLTSFTTGIGFLSLANSRVEPFILLGVLGSIGVLIAFILTYTLLPALLRFTGLQFLKRPVLQRKGGFKKLLSRLFRLIARAPRWIAIITLVVVLCSAYGMQRITSDNYLLEDLSPDLEIVKDHAFFEEDFSGIRPFEYALSLQHDSLSMLDRAVLDELQLFQELLKQHDVRSVLSPLELVKNLNRAYRGGKDAAYVLPKSDRQLARIQKQLGQNAHKEGIKQFLASDLKTGRLQGKMRDIGSYQSRQLYEQIATQTASFKYLTLRPTGTVYVMEKNNLLLSKNVYQGLLVAVALIAILVGILFRSKRMVLIAVFVNLLPLLMIAGFMGFMGISLKIATAIIFAISFGIAVDDTIHFLSKLKIELDKGRSMLHALYRTYLTTGKAIVITTFIVSGGFLTLTLSDFGGTFYIGLLICMTMLFALLADLFVLPVLIMLLFRSKK